MWKCKRCTACTVPWSCVLILAADEGGSIHVLVLTRRKGAGKYQCLGPGKGDGYPSSRTWLGYPLPWERTWNQRPGTTPPPAKGLTTRDQRVPLPHLGKDLEPGTVEQGYSPAWWNDKVKTLPSHTSNQSELTDLPGGCRGGMVLTHKSHTICTRTSHVNHHVKPRKYFWWHCNTVKMATLRTFHPSIFHKPMTAKWCTTFTRSLNPSLFQRWNFWKPHIDHRDD